MCDVVVLSLQCFLSYEVSTHHIAWHFVVRCACNGVSYYLAGMCVSWTVTAIRSRVGGMRIPDIVPAEVDLFHQVCMCYCCCCCCCVSLHAMFCVVRFCFVIVFVSSTDIVVRE